MEKNSSINNLIGTFATLSKDDNANIISGNVVCIDTSNQRIGINTLDPSYGIHIKDEGLMVETSTNTKIIFKNLPDSSNNLDEGQLYKDDDGNLKIKLLP